MRTIMAKTAKVMSKGQVKIPKDVRDALGVESGDTLMFIQDGMRVYVMNAAQYAMGMLQAELAGAADAAGITEDDIDALVADARAGLAQ